MDIEIILEDVDEETYKKVKDDGLITLMVKYGIISAGIGFIDIEGPDVTMQQINLKDEENNQS